MHEATWKKIKGDREYKYQQFKEACDNNAGLSRPRLYAGVAKSFGWRSKNQLLTIGITTRYFI